MKRVIDGKAYNTVTAEVIATTEGTYQKRSGGEDWRYFTTLHRTPKGAWFLVEEEWIDDEQPEDEREVRTSFRVINGVDGALDWVKKTECELHKADYFPAFEEA